MRSAQAMTGRGMGGVESEASSPPYIIILGALEERRHRTGPQIRSLATHKPLLKISEQGEQEGELRPAWPAEEAT